MANLQVVFMYVSVIAIVIGGLGVLAGVAFGLFAGRWIVLWISLVVTVIAFILFAILGTTSGEFARMESIRLTEEALRPTPEPTETPKPTATPKPPPTPTPTREQQILKVCDLDPDTPIEKREDALGAIYVVTLGDHCIAITTGTGTRAACMPMGEVSCR